MRRAAGWRDHESCCWKVPQVRDESQERDVQKERESCPWEGESDLCLKRSENGGGVCLKRGQITRVGEWFLHIVKMTVGMEEEWEWKLRNVWKC
jgi:hypothetical protein